MFITFYSFQQWWQILWLVERKINTEVYIFMLQIIVSLFITISGIAGDK